jgi:hypothetical protein
MHFLTLKLVVFIVYLPVYVGNGLFNFKASSFIVYLPAEFLKFVGPSDRSGQIFGRSDRSLILGGPIVRQGFKMFIFSATVFFVECRYR